MTAESIYAMFAVEDVLAQALGVRILKHVGITVSRVLGLRGNGWLFTNSRKLNLAAAHFPVIVLTDLDVPNRCPLDIVDKLCPKPRHANFVARVCVLEAEGWVLADSVRFARFIGIAHEKLPHEPDGVVDPKELLVSLARKGRNRRVREDLVPVRGSTAKVGPAYNAVLTDFVATEWDPLAASKASPSLARALRAFETLKARLMANSSE